MIETLFKFDRINFAEGSVGFLSGSVAVWVLIGLALLGGLILLYRSTDRYARPRDRAVSFGLRAAALALLCLPLLEPALITPDVVPDENFVAVVMDASESMNVPDGRSGGTRLQDVRTALERAVPEIEEHFKVRYYAFGDEARRVDSVEHRAAGEHGTNLSRALDRVLTDFRGLPLAGVVMLTDGADNSEDVPLNQAEALRDRDVPLHVVGVGRETAEGERELLEAAVVEGVDETTGSEIDVQIRSWRAEPEPVEIGLYLGDALVRSESHALKGDGKVDRLTLFYETAAAQAGEYSVRIAAADDEINTTNNSENVLIDPRRDTLRVLFIEGHPRPDFKFIKRALEDDPAVHFTSILRTGTGKFYRQGIRRSDELAGGFPATDEELFTFDAVLFGDVEASHFSLTQLEMIERFVRLRGGGFAMLGGRSAFAEGAYWDNPIADLLPVELDLSRRTVLPRRFDDAELSPAEQGFRFTPTAAGLASPILRLSADPSENRARWAQMPGLTSINLLGRVKPGAAVLAEKPDDTFGGSEPLLVVQRYGKGRSAALATASTWRWQMLLEADDERHERFWRQLARWLAASAPGRVEASIAADRYAPGDEVEVRVDLFDASYGPVPDAVLSATLTDPAGTATNVTFRPDLGSSGSYTATLLPASDGVYYLDVAATTADGESIGGDRESFLVTPSRKEYYDAVLKRSFLEHLATTAGGFYYAPENADEIAPNLRGRRTSTSIYTIDYLWDMPFLFGLVLVLLSAEWIFRRRKGLP